MRKKGLSRDQIEERNLKVAAETRKEFNRELGPIIHEYQRIFQSVMTALPSDSSANFDDQKEIPCPLKVVEQVTTQDWLGMSVLVDREILKWFSAREKIFNTKIVNNVHDVRPSWHFRVGGSMAIRIPKKRPGDYDWLLPTCVEFLYKYEEFETTVADDKRRFPPNGVPSHEREKLELLIKEGKAIFATTDLRKPKFAIVYRSFFYKEPWFNNDMEKATSPSDQNDTRSRGTFVPGSARGVFSFYETASFTHVCAYPVAATNSSGLSISGNDIARLLVDDLAKNLIRELHKKLSKPLSVSPDLAALKEVRVTNHSNDNSPKKTKKSIKSIYHRKRR